MKFAFDFNVSLFNVALVSAFLHDLHVCIVNPPLTYWVSE